MMDIGVLKVLADFGIAGIGFGLFVWFELTTWKNREESQRKDKCDLLAVLKANTEAMTVLGEAIKGVKEIILFVGGKDAQK